MAYKEEDRIKVLALMKTKSIKEIAKETGISQATLYKWRKDEEIKILEKKATDDEVELMKKYRKSDKKENIKKAEELAREFFYDTRIQSQLIKIYIKTATKLDVEKVEEIADRFPNNEIIQSQLMTIYIKNRNEENIEKAKEIASKFPNHIPSQSQLMTIYIRNGREEDIEKAEEIADRFPNNEVIQSQLMTIYIKRGKADIKKVKEIASRFPNNVIIKTQVNQLYKKVDKRNRKNANILKLIRAKIYIGTIKNEDIKELRTGRNGLRKKQYYLILIAIYEKLGQKNNALQVIKQMEEEGIKLKGLNDIKERLKSKKRVLFDLGKWDEIIGWDVSITKQYEEERRKLEEDNQQKINIPVSKNEGKNDKKEEKKLKKRSTNLVKRVQNSVINNEKNKNEEVTVSKKNIVKEKKKVSKDETIFSTLSKNLKEVIDEINRNYYVKMQPKRIKSDTVKEYQQFDIQRKYICKYDKLQSILSCNSNNKRATMELMLVLINEGYREIAKKEFPQEYYEFLDITIKQYYEKTIEPEEAKKQVDEYCR